MTTQRPYLHLLLLAVVSALPGCKTPSVNLSTPDPIKVDINMRLDVYQHGGNGKTPEAKPVPGAKPTPPPSDAGSRRLNRMADIQNFKNSRLVGEGHDGLLLLVPGADLSGDYGAYVKAAVDAENADRLDLMKRISDEKKISLPNVQEKQAEVLRQKAFKGEWIEVPGKDGTYQFVQKQG